MLLRAGRVSRNARHVQKIDPLRSRGLSPIWLLPSAYQSRSSPKRWTSSTPPLSAPPATSPSSSTASPTTTTTTTTTKKTGSPASSVHSVKSKETSRNLSTVASSYPDLSGNDILPPYADPGTPPPVGLFADHSLWRPDGPGSMLILQTPRQSEITDLRTATVAMRKDPYYLGLIGHKQEAEANFHALLKVGDLERAEQMLLRMSETSKTTESPLQVKEGDKMESLGQLDLVNNHNAFLGAMLETAKEIENHEQRVKNLQGVVDWYFKMVQEFNMEGNATTLAIILEASFRKEDTLQMQRQLIRFVEIWRGRPNHHLGDLLKDKYLSDEALVTIIKVCQIQPQELYPEQQVKLEKYKVEKPSMEGVPEIKAATIKGHGLKAVQQSLRSFTDPDYIPVNVSAVAPDHPDAEFSDYLFREERQKLLEKDAYSSALEKWQADFKAMLDRGTPAFNKDVGPLMYTWHQDMIPLIKEELERIDLALAVGRDKGQPHGRYDYGPLLKLISPEKLAALTILTVMKHAATDNVTDGMRTTTAVISVGKAVEMESITEEIRSKEAADAKSGNGYKVFDTLKSDKDMRKYIYYFRKQRNESQELTEDTRVAWSKRYQGIIGGLLVSMLIHCAKVPVRNPNAPKPADKAAEKAEEYQDMPAFYHTYQYTLGKKVGVVKLHPELMSKMSSMPLGGNLLSKQLPMVVEPLPWKSWNKGGYYYSRVKVIRTKDSMEQAMYSREASKRGDLEMLYSGLDVLGATSWNIHQKVFNVVAEVWNSGESLGAIPSATPKELPDEPPADASPEVRKAWLKTCKRINTENYNNHSQRCDVNFKLEIARAFYHEKFYFPHNVDFRGRAYPIPPHLNHLGNDLCRGLLIFAEAKPLGEKGLRWMKIHLANVCGFDKASLDERVEYTESHLEDIYDSAERPLDGRRWWLEAEDPWQCLSTCFELTAALKSENPTEYKSRLPVHQDGTCNGLQHYAALGGDIDGARQVNLSPSNRPQDVYTGVMNLVKKEMELDLQAGKPTEKKWAAIALPIMKRKIVKQPVMTSVYGVTFHGAKQQVRNRLEEVPELDHDMLPGLSSYITKRVFGSLKTMFTGAHEIQGWFGECARRISKSISPTQFDDILNVESRKITDQAKLARAKSASKTTAKVYHGKNQGVGSEFMSSVIWTTPLGMPVVQPYRTDAKIVVKTNLQDISITDPHVLKEVNWRKQFAAFPPNFVHSLDASHMILSALSSKEAGLTFAAVHDSFWTHACDVDQMSTILRDAFVRLHEGNIIARLRDEFMERYKDFKTLVSVPLSHPAGKAIVMHRQKIGREAKKIGRLSSITAYEDLKREITREQLLASKDPKERKQGEDMVTAGSILEKFRYGLDDDAQQVSSTDQFGSLKLKASKATDKLSYDQTENPEDAEAASSPEEKKTKNTRKSKKSTAESGEQVDEASAEEAGEEDGVAKDEDGAEKFPIAPPQALVHAWVDLTFPAVPEKGDFDVKDLKESVYFFS